MMETTIKVKVGDIFKYTNLTNGSSRIVAVNEIFDHSLKTKMYGCVIVGGFDPGPVKIPPRCYLGRKTSYRIYYVAGLSATIAEWKKL